MKIEDCTSTVIPHIKIICENDDDYHFLTRTYINKTDYTDYLTYFNYLKSYTEMSVSREEDFEIINKYINNQDRIIKLKYILEC
jgi:hypothetical protein